MARTKEERWVIAVTGSSRAEGRIAEQLVRAALRHPRFERADQVIMIHGAAPGIDTIAAREGYAAGFDLLPVPYFSKQGNLGGFARNDCMAEVASVFQSYGYKAICLAFPDAQSSGTIQCQDAFKRAGIPVVKKRL